MNRWTGWLVGLALLTSAGSVRAYEEHEHGVGASGSQPATPAPVQEQVLTGLQAEEVAKHSFEIWQIMQLHKRLGITTLILGLTTAGFRVGMRDWPTGRARALTVAAMLLMASTLSVGAYLGGRYHCLMIHPTVPELAWAACSSPPQGVG
ncbi:MAG: hypothetical protein HYY59_06930 [Candidatus Omnitrophica bacterium]|nr:hypothetical protein [Candidatus Omnitrophota bacterium]MBI2496211.1 hypothetical protein [Candidatus Omnitrophota bacterium]MBI3021711.1 hypothetical protein [Candidatus Omnitrophota bacterium]